MPQNKLFDEESEDENLSFDAKGEYAKRYDAWRQKEELHKLEQKYGDKALNSDGEVSSDSEDEEPQEMSPEMEEQFLKTLALLKTKDPRIYDPQFKCFEEAEERRKLKEEIAEKELRPKKEVNSLAAAFADSDDDDDDENNDGGIFKVEKKAPQTQDKGKKQDKLRAYLTGSAAAVDSQVEAELAPLRALWADPRLDDGEKFLRDYILNKRYEGDSSGAGEAAGKLRDDADLEADEEIVEEQGRFERAYNFRFEEPDQDYLKRYPRTMNYIRPKDDKRSKKRVEVKTRKEEEKAKKMEEIARLKALKLKEIQEKIARIKEVTGNDELAFKDEDIEGDFDPEAHDRRMRAIFDEQYYGEADEEKPTFPDLDEELEIENWDEYEPEHGAAGADTGAVAPHCEDEDFNMDADYDPKRNRATLLEEIQETLGKKRRNRKKKTKLAALLEASAGKPKFVPNAVDKTYAEYMEEYYKMDCEDVIAGELPTRFKYRDVVPNDFGLSIEEILLADDKELNRWASLKKTVKYRPENVERSEVTTYSLKAADPQLKRTLLPSLFKDLPEEPEVVVPVVINKKKNKANVNTDDPTNADENIANDNMDESKELNDSINSEVVGKKKKKKKNKKNANNNTAAKVSQGNQVPANSSGDTKNGSKSLATESVNSDSKLNESAEGKKKRRRKKKKPNQATLMGKALHSGPSQNNNKEPSKTQFKKDVAKQNQDVKTPIKPSENNKNKSHGDVKPAHAQIANKGSQPPTPGKVNNLKRKLESNQTDNETKPAKQKKANKQNQVTQQNGGAIKNNNKNKMKNKVNNKNKGKSDKQDNPLSKLSDERLKAYGLNPKKYRSFLKYKKF